MFSLHQFRVSSLFLSLAALSLMGQAITAALIWYYLLGGHQQFNTANKRGQGEANTTPCWSKLPALVAILGDNSSAKLDQGTGPAYPLGLHRSPCPPLWGSIETSITTHLAIDEL